MSSGTLTTMFGPIWEIRSHGGRASYHYPSLGIDITYHPIFNEYVVWVDDALLFSYLTISCCLERTSTLIMDHYASHFSPMWAEMGSCEDVTQYAETIEAA